MKIRLKPEPGDVWAGVIGLRAPDGSIAKTVKFYTADPDGEVAKPGQLTENEKEVCDGVVRQMARIYKETADAMKAFDERRKEASTK